MTIADLTTVIRNIQVRHRLKAEMMKGMHVPYFRRGEMAIPAFKMKASGNPEIDGRETSLKLMKKVTGLDVDFFFYDLEDASPDNPDFKDHARRFVVEVLTTTDFGHRIVAFRPNNIRTEYFEQDIIQVVSGAGDRLQAIVIPKTEYAEEVQDIIDIVRRVQRISGHTNKISFEVLIESPRAFLEAERIASIDEVSTLIFGAWDFARTTGGMVAAGTWTEDQQYARQRLPIIAAAYGKDAVDAVTGTLPLRPPKPEGITREEYDHALATDPTTVDKGKFGTEFSRLIFERARALDLARRDALNARRCGYSAKWILHPDQIGVIQAAWTPSREEAIRALGLAALYTRAAENGSGAEVDGNRLADKAVVGTEWWIVRAALQAKILNHDDITRTGFTMKQLERTIVTHD